MRATGRVLGLALLVGLAPALAACAGDTEEATMEDTEVAPPATEAATEALRVTEVDLGNAIGADMRVTDDDDTDDFSPNDTIYVSVATEGSASGSTLTARWTFEDGQVVDESSRTISPGANVTEFHISNPGGFPTGEYRVEILLDGRVVETEEFEVN